MRPEQSGGVLRLAGRRGGFSWQSGFAVGTPPPAPAFRAAVTAAAQDASAVAASLGLDRSTRRLIQQGLRNEGFDAGAPDGLFGPRTRAAIRAWQAAREQAETGYLDGMQAETLRAAGAPDSSPVDASASAATLADPAAPAVRAAGSSEAQGSATPSPPLAAPAIVEASTESASPAVNCEGWNTRGFFNAATVEAVTACLAAGADVAAHDARDYTPLHYAARDNENLAVVEALLAAGVGTASPLAPSRLFAWREP